MKGWGRILRSGGKHRLILIRYTIPVLALVLSLPSAVSAQNLALKSYQDKGYRVQYLEGGKGPTVLLVHGLGVARWSFLKLGEQMAANGFRVLLPDVPGQGETEHDQKRSYSIISQADYLKRFLDARRVQKVVVIGNSMGGHIAASLALRYPYRVSKLILISPAGLQAGGPPPYSVLMIPDDADDQKKADLEWNNHVREDIRSGVHYLMDPVLPRLTIPTLILWGDQDEIIPPSLAEEWKKRIPRSRLIILEELGHMAQDDDPDTVLSEIQRFVSPVR